MAPPVLTPEFRRFSMKKKVSRHFRVIFTHPGSISISTLSLLTIAKALYGQRQKMCRRASVFSCRAVPSHQALKHLEIEASLVYEVGVEFTYLEGYSGAVENRSIAHLYLELSSS